MILLMDPVQKQRAFPVGKPPAVNGSTKLSPYLPKPKPGTLNPAP